MLLSVPSRHLTNALAGSRAVRVKSLIIKKTTTRLLMVRGPNFAVTAICTPITGLNRSHNHLLITMYGVLVIGLP